MHGQSGLYIRKQKASRGRTWPSRAFSPFSSSRYHRSRKYTVNEASRAGFLQHASFFSFLRRQKISFSGNCEGKKTHLVFLKPNIPPPFQRSHCLNTFKFRSNSRFFFRIKDSATEDFLPPLFFFCVQPRLNPNDAREITQTDPHDASLRLTYYKQAMDLKETQINPLITLKLPARLKRRKKIKKE